MHSLKINVNNEAYNHLIYILNEMSNVEIKEDKIIKIDKKKKFLQRVKKSDNDIKNGRVSDFNFDDFLKDIDEI
ncbi:hypothetical protein MNB_SV-15-466 [hydrothermal vent metagenome]|uniref:Uncharacterized protein n=1 Tax=hydrothermal vent metagenome TaxID=652676 RepID=A0A1W1EIZ9_9ZZZZ